MTDIYRVADMTEDHARAIATWDTRTLYDRPLQGSWVVLDHRDRLIGHMDAVDDRDAVTVVADIHPDRLAQQTAFMRYVFHAAAERHPGLPLRTTVASFDERTLDVVRRLGFRETEIFRNSAGREFVVFERC